MGQQPDKAGPHLRWGLEGARPNIKAALRSGRQGQHHRQAAIALVPGPGNHAVNDFALQHEMHVGDQAAKTEQMEQQWRGDVVGEVTDYA